MKRKITRREFMKIGAKTGIGFFAVTACGNLLAMSSGRKIKLAKMNVDASEFIIETKELEKLGAVNFKYKRKRAILLFNGGEIRAFENICTHRGGATKLTNNKLICKRHRAVFDPLTGEALKRPAPSGSKLRAVNIEERNGKIYIVSP